MSLGWSKLKRGHSWDSHLDFNERFVAYVTDQRFGEEPMSMTTVVSSTWMSIHNYKVYMYISYS